NLPSPDHATAVTDSECSCFLKTFVPLDVSETASVRWIEPVARELPSAEIAKQQTHSSCELRSVSISFPFSRQREIMLSPDPAATIRPPGNTLRVEITPASILVLRWGASFASFHQ